MRAPLLLVAVLPLLTAACDETLGGDEVDTAVVSISAYADGAGGFRLAPIALFYASANIVLNQPAAGLCEIFGLDAEQSPIIDGFNTLDVGPFILARLPAGEDTLYLSTATGLRIYELNQLDGVAHSPGDTMTVTVPANVTFPAASASVRTAESFTIGPVGVPELNQDLSLTWEGATEPGSAMRFSLRYTTGNSAEFNEQVVCIFADDGEGEIDAGFLQGWVNAPGERQVIATRVRAHEVEVSAGSRMMLIATFQVPTPQIVP